MFDQCPDVTSGYLRAGIGVVRAPFRARWSQVLGSGMTSSTTTTVVPRWKLSASTPFGPWLVACRILRSLVPSTGWYTLCWYGFVGGGVGKLNVDFINGLQYRFYQNTSFVRIFFKMVRTRALYLSVYKSV